MHMQEPHSWYANSKNVSLFGVWIMVFDTKTFEQFPFALYYGDVAKACVNEKSYCIFKELLSKILRRFAAQ